MAASILEQPPGDSHIEGDLVEFSVIEKLLNLITAGLPAHDRLASSRRGTRGRLVTSA